MKPTLAIVAAGSMGAAVGRRLVDHGLTVLTSLTGRSADSRARASAAGMQAVRDETLVESDLLLSIVPPAAALPFAERMAPALRSARRKPLFVDCNAVSPATVRRIHTVIADSGAPFIDAGIIGAPPQANGGTPRFYASGEHAARLQVLCEHGLDVQLLEGPVGAASALKMAYAGITKGRTAIVTAMILAAARAGCADALRSELAHSQQELMTSLPVQIPGMFPKAYRWVAEMQEIADFAADDPAAHDIYTAVSRLYDRIAQDGDGDRRERSVLLEFLSSSSR